MFRFYKALLITAVSVIIIAFFSLFGYRGDYARKIGDDNSAVGALAVFLSVGLGSRDGQAFAEATNKLTVFSGEVKVTLRLYRSNENPLKSDEKMEVVAETSVEDLDFTESVAVSYPVGEGSYFWMAEIVYSVDGGAEKTLDTKIMFFDGNGGALEIG